MTHLRESRCGIFSVERRPDNRQHRHFTQIIVQLDFLISLLPHLSFLIGAGLVAGFVAGLFGVGGGTVTVPVLFYWFLHMQVPSDVAMHTAVATSLATIIATSLASSRAYERRGSIDHVMLRRWAPFIAVGSIVGAALAAVLSGAVLRGIFGGFLLSLAIYMLFGSYGRMLQNRLPSKPWQRLIAGLIGTLSSLAGIGGGAVSVPVMTFYNVPMQMAAGTSSAFGVIIAVPAVVGLVLIGWDHASLPAFSVGYVNLLALAVLLPATAIMAPIGAGLAQGLSKRLLRRMFGVFLTAVASKMLWGLVFP